jgi:hypothetical protein
MRLCSEADVFEPEVLPPAGRKSHGGARVAETTGPWGVNPVIAGLLIDLVNIPFSGLVGFVAGGTIGYWASTSNRLPIPMALLIGLATGWYCGLPLPRTVPLATLVGVIIVLWRRWGR